MLENLITDRTEADVLRWKALRDKGWANMTETERAEWSAGLKGAYNATDLNRVGEALNYLRDELTEAGYIVGTPFTMPTTWNNTHIPTSASFAEYLRAVEFIRSQVVQKATTPTTPMNTGSLDYQGANDIEQILIDIYENIQLMLASTRYYSGDLYSGEI